MDPGRDAGTARRASRRPAAHEAALRELERRPLTAHELATRLRRQGYAAPEVERVCQRLRAAGLLDDARLARDFIVLRGERLGHGPERLKTELRRRGVDATLVERVWREALEAGDVDPRQQLRQRLGRLLGGRSAAADARTLSRVVGRLLRAGFPAALIEEELGPHEAFPALPDVVPEEDDR